MNLKHKSRKQTRTYVAQSQIGSQPRSLEQTWLSRAGPGRHAGFQIASREQAPLWKGCPAVRASVRHLHYKKKTTTVRALLQHSSPLLISLAAPFFLSVSLPLAWVLLSVSDSLALSGLFCLSLPCPDCLSSPQPLLLLARCLSLTGIFVWVSSRSLLPVLSLSAGQASVGPPMEESVAHAVAAVGGRLYISGGFGGVALGRLLALTIPPDSCRLLPSPEACNQSGACTWCHGVCFSGDQAHR